MVSNHHPGNNMTADEYLQSIDETPRFAANATEGTTPIEHYLRRLVTYLARLQSVAQNSENGLALKAYVHLDSRAWLRMFRRTAPQRESPLEVPRQEVAHATEEYHCHIHQCQRSR